MKIFIFIIVFLGVSIIPVFRESRLEYLKITNPSFYELEVDNNVFLIPYETDAEVIAMEIDPELTFQKPRDVVAWLQLPQFNEEPLIKKLRSTVGSAGLNRKFTLFQIKGISIRASNSNFLSCFYIK